MLLVLAAPDGADEHGFLAALNDLFTLTIRCYDVNMQKILNMYIFA